MCEKCNNNMSYAFGDWDTEVYRCQRCGTFYTGEYLKHELLHDKWEDNWRDLFKRFGRDDEDYI